MKGKGRREKGGERKVEGKQAWSGRERGADDGSQPEKAARHEH